MMVVMRYLAVLVLVFSGSYSYSEFEYGTTSNAADNRLNWVMKNVLPDASNLSVNGVFYQYTPVKVKEDAMKVHVQNENALGSGYIFRETDDWTGMPGGIPINKVVGVDNIPEAAWGDGSIEVEGTGSVIDTSVIYSYKYDNTCANPIDDPTCPGYNDAIQSVLNSISEPVAYDVMGDENVKDVLNDKVELEEEADEEEQEEDDRLEKALSAVDVGALDANTIAQDHLMQALSLTANITPYYELKIQGGEYNEVTTLTDSKLPDNKKGARVGLAQQLKHNEMVDMQYNIGE
jgi:hypothetical protein